MNCKIDHSFISHWLCSNKQFNSVTWNSNQFDSVQCILFEYNWAEFTEICTCKWFAVILNSLASVFIQTNGCSCRTLTCAGITVPLFALGLHVGAESSGEVFVHYAANVPLVVGKEDTSWAQVFCLPDLFALRSLFYLSGRSIRWWGQTPWAGASGRN